MGEKIIQKAVEILSLPERGEHWGGKYEVSPAVCSESFGDGLQFIYVTPLNTRPNYYVVRIDSGVIVDVSTDVMQYLMDEIYQALEEEFGRICDYHDSQSEDNECYDRHSGDNDYDFPVLSDDCGSIWSEAINLGKPNGIMELAWLKKQKSRS